MVGVSSHRSTRTGLSYDMSSLLKQPTFEFRVGQEQEVISVHVGIFDGNSEPLHRMMTGPMKEGQERVACLPTWEIDVVRAACEYAYRKGYTCPDQRHTSCGQGESHFSAMSCSQNMTLRVCTMLWYLIPSLHSSFYGLYRSARSKSRDSCSRIAKSKIG